MAGRILRAGSGPVAWYNVPNLISLVRIALTPVFVWILALDDGQMGPLRWAAAIFFVVAIASDALDGYLARSRNLVTDFGKILDPIADKALTGAALVMLTVLGELPLWVTIVILAREIGITVYRMVVIRNRVIAASSGGKLKTVMQAVAITTALMPMAPIVGEWWFVVNIVTMSIALALTVWSGIDYLVKAFRA